MRVGVMVIYCESSVDPGRDASRLTCYFCRMRKTLLLGLGHAAELLRAVGYMPVGIDDHGANV